MDIDTLLNPEDEWKRQQQTKKSARLCWMHERQRKRAKLMVGMMMLMIMWLLKLAQHIMRSFRQHQSSTATLVVTV